MNKAKLKVLVMALKEILEELESEVYSDVDAYQSMQVSTSKKLDYDESMTMVQTNASITD